MSDPPDGWQPRVRASLFVSPLAISSHTIAPSGGHPGPPRRVDGVEALLTPVPARLSGDPDESDTGSEEEEPRRDGAAPGAGRPAREAREMRASSSRCGAAWGRGP